MEADVLLFLSILFGMVALFLSGKAAVDLTALTGLVLMILLGLLSPADAFKGFSSPAVITLGSMFVIAAGLKRSGFADDLASLIVKIAGRNESLLIAVIMLFCGSISFFVNNLAIVALLMPTVFSISNRSGVPPSRMLLPLAYASILGGVGTLIGTTPNILVVDMMESLGTPQFRFFDFAPFGVVMLLVGTLYMASLGKYLLPKINVSKSVGGSERARLSELYKLDERIFTLAIPIDSNLHEKSLNELRFAEVLGVQVITIRRQGKIIQAPRGTVVLQALDVLTVGGREDDLQRLLSLAGIKAISFSENATSELDKRVLGGTLEILKDKWVGKPVKSIQFKERYGLAITGMDREGTVPANFLDLKLREGDLIHIIGTPQVVNQLGLEPGLILKDSDTDVDVLIENELSELIIPDDSPLDGSTVREASILERLGITILGIDRGEHLLLAPMGRELLKAGDKLIVAGDSSQIEMFESLGDLKVHDEGNASSLESKKVGIAEAALSPRSRLIGKTLFEINFRQKYDLQVLALWRNGRPRRSDLQHKELRLGDAMLLQGSRSKLNLLSEDPDFLLLEQVPVKPKTRARYFALASFLMVILLSAFELQQVHVAALIGALVAVLGGAVKISDAYRYIEWRILVLIAVLISVGTAFQTTGAAALIASSLVGPASDSGVLPLAGATVLLSSIFSQLTDGSLSVVLLAPIVAESAAKMGIAAEPLYMMLTLGASIAYLTPFSHKASLLVFGAGGYKVRHYLWSGLFMTLITLIITLFLVPRLFPF